MGRPAPRKSSLAGRTPVTPPPADPAPADPAPPAAAPAVQEQPAAVAPEKKGKYPGLSCTPRWPKAPGRSRTSSITP